MRRMKLYNLAQHLFGLSGAVLGSLLAAVTLSGCLLFGIGAAAGAAAGGCALLDENEDDRITEAELSEGIFSAWDTNGDDALSQAEFEAGAERSDAFSNVSDEFDEWDTNDSGELSRQEFAAGVAAEQDTLALMDARCDELGL